MAGITHAHSAARQSRQWSKIFGISAGNHLPRQNLALGGVRSCSSLVTSSSRPHIRLPGSRPRDNTNGSLGVRHFGTEKPFKLSNPEIFKDKALIGGRWIEADSGARFEIIDPGTALPWATAPNTSVSEANAAVSAATKAFESYQHTNPRTRAQLLLKWHQLITDAREDLAQIVVYETGKTYTEAIGEINYALGFPWWFAGEAERIRGTVSVPATPGRRVITVKQPIGVTVAMVPWNFPIAMILRKAGAALAAGCTMVIKPSPETPLSVLTLAYLASKAGFPDGVLNVLTTDLTNTPAVSEALCTHPDVKKVTFTGSTAVGKLIARHCSASVKKVTLELGGNCPAIVFDDADLDQACEAISGLKWRNAGQACVGANRVYVQRGVYDRVCSMLTEQAQKLKMGHGAKEGMSIGAMTTKRGVEKAEGLVRDAVAQGARVLLGHDGSTSLSSSSPASSATSGFFFPPTVLAEASASMRLAQEESFSPILPIFPFVTEDDVISLANATSLGLAAYAFTKDADRTWRLSERLQAGMIGINTGNQSAAESPFGGIKESGYGKEAGMGVAVEEYLVSKTVTVTVVGLDK